MQSLSLVFPVTLIYQTFQHNCKKEADVRSQICDRYIHNTCILSPSGVVSICPGGQVLLTCVRTSASFLQLCWNVSVPHLATPRERIVTSQGVIQPEFGIGFMKFNITLTSPSSGSLTSRMLMNNVTTEINGSDSTIYCSKDGNKANARVIAINVIIIQRYYNS